MRIFRTVPPHRTFPAAAWLMAAALAFSAAAAPANVTVLQNGVAPGQDYAGCKDTWISNEDWERNRVYGKSATLRSGGKRHTLIRFDLAGIPKGETIHKAVLRLADASFPRPRRRGDRQHRRHALRADG